MARCIGFIGVCVWGLTGCAESPVEVPLDEGAALYEQAHDDGNTFACATCHALEEPSDDGFRRAGHPIGDAAHRPSFKNGQLDTLIDAVNSCREEWMTAPAFAKDDPRWQALASFLQDQAPPGEAEPLDFEVVAPPGDLGGGDAAAGATTFATTCALCHGSGGSGTQLAPAIAGTTLSAEAIAERIRLSGSPESTVYEGLTFGRMPFWAADRLSDTELRDLVAFLDTSEPVEIPMTSGDEEDLSLDGAQSNCASTHPSVGRSLTFAGHAHDVAGMATIVDDCTILFEGFSFDGGGIDVRVYGGSGGGYSDGITLSVNLVGKAFESHEAVLRLPTGISLDDFDGLSIWCVPVGISFGDGQFQ